MVARVGFEVSSLLTDFLAAGAGPFHDCSSKAMIKRTFDGKTFSLLAAALLPRLRLIQKCKFQASFRKDASGLLVLSPSLSLSLSRSLSLSLSLSPKLVDSC